MIYAVEAVDLDPQGRVERLRWHCVDFKDDLVHGKSKVVDIEEALRVSSDDRVHVCFKGAPGSQLARESVDGRETFVDAEGAPAGQRLADLPALDAA